MCFAYASLFNKFNVIINANVSNAVIVVISSNNEGKEGEIKLQSN